MKKFALIHLGTHEVYGLCFVAHEIERLHHAFRWFDGEDVDAVGQIASWGPDFVCFSPLCAFLNQAVALAKAIKVRAPYAKMVFGGIHVSANPDILLMDGVDFIVAGPVYGTINRILASTGKDLFRGYPAPSELAIPDKRAYYGQIPRIGNRHVKMLMSHFGCAFNCSYCTTGAIRNRYGAGAYKAYWLTRRPVSSVIDEAKVFLDFPTEEVELSDDDMLQGSDSGQWLGEFFLRWKTEIGLPIFGNVTPGSVNKALTGTMELLAGHVSSVCIGLQAVRKGTLELFNRQNQSSGSFKGAVQRLHNYGIPVKIDVIVGNPVPDPIGDAIESILFAQSLPHDDIIATVYPLMVYPGTPLQRWCEDHAIPMNDACEFNWYTGVGSVKFVHGADREIRNLVKLGNLFIRHKVPERWIRALIELHITEDDAKRIALCNYGDSLRHRGMSEEKIADVLRSVHLYS